MADKFSLTAVLRVQGPANLRDVVNNLNRAFRNVNASVNLKIREDTARRLNTVNNRLTKLNDLLREVQRNATTAAAALAKMSNVFRQSTSRQNATGLEHTNNGLARLKKNTGETLTSLEEFGRVSGGIARRFAAFSLSASVLFGVVTAFRAGIKESIDFQKQMVRLSQVTGSTINGLRGISDTITELSTGLGVSSAELAEVSVTFAQAGFNIKQTQQALAAIAKTGVAATFDNMQDTAEGAIAIMQQFGVRTDELEKKLSSLNSVAAAFAVESSDIITAVRRTGGAFESAGGSFEELLALFTSVRQTTRESAESIATGFRTIFTRLQRPATIRFLREFGIELTDLQGKFIGPRKAIEELSKALANVGTGSLQLAAIQEEIGGFRQISKTIPLIQEFSTTLRALAIAEAGSNSLTNDAAVAQAAFATQINRVKEEFFALFRSISETNTFKRLFDTIIGGSHILINLGRAAKETLPVLTALFALGVARSVVPFGKNFVKGLRNVSTAAASVNSIASGLSDTTAEARRSKALAEIAANTTALNAVDATMYKLITALDQLRLAVGTGGLGGGGGDFRDGDITGRPRKPRGPRGPAPIVGGRRRKSSTFEDSDTVLDIDDVVATTVAATNAATMNALSTDVIRRRYGRGQNLPAPDNFVSDTIYSRSTSAQTTAAAAGAMPFLFTGAMPINRRGQQTFLPRRNPLQLGYDPNIEQFPDLGEKPRRRGYRGRFIANLQSKAFGFGQASGVLSNQDKLLFENLFRKPLERLGLTLDRLPQLLSQALLRAAAIPIGNPQRLALPAPQRLLTDQRPISERYPAGFGSDVLLDRPGTRGPMRGGRESRAIGSRILQLTDQRNTGIADINARRRGTLEVRRRRHRVLSATVLPATPGVIPLRGSSDLNDDRLFDLEDGTSRNTTLQSRGGRNLASLTREARLRQARRFLRRRAFRNFGNNIGGALSGLRGRGVGIALAGTLGASLIPTNEIENDRSVGNRGRQLAQSGIAGAATGALIGSAIAPGVGTALGAVAGAAVGLTTTFLDQKRRIEEADLGKSVDSLKNNLDGIIAGNIVPGGKTSELLVKDLRSILITAQGQTGEERARTLGSISTPNLRQALSFSATQFNSFDEFADAAGGANIELVKLAVVASDGRLQYDKLIEQIKTEITTRQNSLEIVRKLNDLQTEQLADLRIISSLTDTIVATRISLDGFASDISSLDELISGRVGAVQFTDRSDLFRLPNINPKVIEEELARIIPASLGAEGENLRKLITGTSEVRNILPQVLIDSAKQFRNVGGEDVGGEIQRIIVDNLAKSIGDKNILRSVETVLADIVSSREPDEFAQRIFADPTGTSEDILKDMTSFLDQAAKLSEELNRSTNEYWANISKSIQNSIEISSRVLDATAQALSIAKFDNRQGRLVNGRTNRLPLSIETLSQPLTKARTDLIGNRDLATLQRDIFSGSARFNEIRNALNSNKENGQTLTASRREELETELKQVSNALSTDRAAIELFGRAVNNVTSELQDRLQQLESLRDAERSEFRSFFDELAFGEPQDRRKLARTAQLSLVSAQRGTLEGLRPQDARRVIEFFESFGQTNFAGLGDRTGSEIADDLRATFAGAFADLVKGRLNGDQFKTEIDATEAAIKASMQTNQDLLNNEIELRKEFNEKLRQTNEEARQAFLQSMETRVQQINAEARNQRITTAQNNLNTAIDREFAGKQLSGLFPGFKDIGQIRSFVTNQISKITEADAKAQNAQNVGRVGLGAVSKTDLTKIFSNKDNKEAGFQLQTLLANSPIGTLLGDKLKPIIDEFLKGRTFEQVVGRGGGGATKEVLQSSAEQEQRLTKLITDALGQAVFQAQNASANARQEALRASGGALNNEQLNNIINNTSLINEQLGIFTDKFTGTLRQLTNEVIAAQQRLDAVTAVPAQPKARGGSIFKRRGTDTVPAMLTPGEFVVNAQSTKNNLPLLKKINQSRKTVYAANGRLIPLGRNNLVRRKEDELGVPESFFTLKERAEISRDLANQSDFNSIPSYAKTEKEIMNSRGRENMRYTLNKAVDEAKRKFNRLPMRQQMAINAEEYRKEYTKQISQQTKDMVSEARNAFARRNTANTNFATYQEHRYDDINVDRAAAAKRADDLLARQPKRISVPAVDPDQIAGNAGNNRPFGESTGGRLKDFVDINAHQREALRERKRRLAAKAQQNPFLNRLGESNTERRAREFREQRKAALDEFRANKAKDRLKAQKDKQDAKDRFVAREKTTVLARGSSRAEARRKRLAARGFAGGGFVPPDPKKAKQFQYLIDKVNRAFVYQEQKQLREKNNNSIENIKNNRAYQERLGRKSRLGVPAVRPDFVDPEAKQFQNLIDKTDRGLQYQADKNEKKRNNYNIGTIQKSKAYQKGMERKMRLQTRGYAAGGFVSGGIGFGDSVPAALSRGEFVLNRGATAKIGVPTLQRFNQGGKVQYKKTGGEVGNIYEQAGAMNEAMTAFSRSMQQFVDNSGTLAAALSAFPRDVNLVGQHKVEVIVNGAEVLTKLDSNIAAMIDTKVSEAFAKFQKKQLPYAGPQVRI